MTPSNINDIGKIASDGWLGDAHEHWTSSVSLHLSGICYQ